MGKRIGGAGVYFDGKSGVDVQPMGLLCAVGESGAEYSLGIWGAIVEKTMR